MDDAEMGVRQGAEKGQCNWIPELLVSLSAPGLGASFNHTVAFDMKVFKLTRATFIISNMKQKMLWSHTTCMNQF